MKKLPMLMLAASLLAAKPAQAQFNDISDKVRTKHDISAVLENAYRTEKPESQSIADSGFVQYNQATRWVMRGLPFSDGRVSQIIGRANHDKFSAILFVNYNPNRECFNKTTQGYDGTFKPVIDEMDVVLMYTTNMLNDKATLTLRGVHEFFAHQQHNQSSELSADFFLNNLPITPMLTVAADIANGKGTYWQLSAISTLPTDIADLTIIHELGFNNHYWRDGSGPSHYGLTATLSRNITDNLMIMATYIGTEPFADDIKSMSLGQASIVYIFR